jgi:hypothetical protein
VQLDHALEGCQNTPKIACEQRLAEGIDSDTERGIEQLIDDWISKNQDSITADLKEHFASLINQAIQETYDDWNSRLGTNFTRPFPIAARVLYYAGRLALFLANRYRVQILAALRRLLMKIDVKDKNQQQILRLVGDFLQSSQLGAELFDLNKQFGAHEAHEIGRLLGHEALGATEKAWITRGDLRVDLVCDRNESEGLIRIRDNFRSGHLTPPAHPGCRCTVEYLGVTRRSMYWASRT